MNNPRQILKWKQCIIVCAHLFMYFFLDRNSPADTELKILNMCDRRPFVPVSLEELSKVKSLKDWTNRNVRVVGMVVVPSHLMSMFEDGGPYSIELDMSLLATPLLCSRPVQVFGELNVTLGITCVKVYFSREMDGDIQSYQKMLELQKKYIPHILHTVDDSDERLLRTLCRLEAASDDV